MPFPRLGPHLLRSLPRRIPRNSLPSISFLSLRHVPARCYSAPSGETKIELAHTRNIGIIAHIDAGKTTTTERMLYYSGFTRRIGDVDEGSTIMDYLPAERARGITITSAAITFNWTPSTALSTPHTINLIDTPGHADFTFEVERSIRVLDGAVTILDGVAGVEAQTEKVWHQAGKFGIPRIIFINKLDRVGARFGSTVKEVARKLKGWPAVCQLPVYERDPAGGEEVFRGVVDVVEKRGYWWDLGGDGRKIDVKEYSWIAEHRPEIYEEALAARVALVELLAEHDEELVETFLELGDHQEIPASAIKSALRKTTLEGTGKIIPIFAGASFRNVGVQPLLDAVVDYLPSPLSRPPVSVSFANKNTALLHPDDNVVCALAFKVVNDPKRGAMVFVRVYSGTLTRSQHLYNTNLAVKERAHRLLQMYANDAIDIPLIPTGHIGVIIGLKFARTGDTLISQQPNITHHAHQKHRHTHTHSLVPPNDYNTLQLKPIDIPPPVFFASLEPHSLGEQKNMEEALGMLLREDPSLHVSTDEDSGQTLISGMGELHLEIARDRLVTEFKAKASMGKILISYRETIPASATPELRKVFDRELAGKKAVAAVTARVAARDEGESGFEEEKDVDSEQIPLENDNLLTIHLEKFSPPDGEGVVTAAKLPSHLSYADIRAAFIAGTSAALSRGPWVGFPVINTAVTLRMNPATDLFGADSTPGAISSAARTAVTAVMKECLVSSEGVLMEPVMRVDIAVQERDMGRVVGDLVGARGGVIVSLDSSEAAGGEEEEEREIDVERVWAPRDVTPGRSEAGGANGERPRVVRARVPLKEMVGYLRQLRGLTGGRGGFVMALEGWDVVRGGRVREVVEGGF
ncbi:Ribosome-releasing factor 2, mitochondrial [Rhizina undulata]